MGRRHTSSLGFLCSFWIRRSEDHEIRGDASIDIFRRFGVVCQSLRTAIHESRIFSFLPGMYG